MLWESNRLAMLNYTIDANAVSSNELKLNHGSGERKWQQMTAH